MMAEILHDRRRQSRNRKLARPPTAVRGAALQAREPTSAKRQDRPARGRESAKMTRAGRRTVRPSGDTGEPAWRAARGGERWPPTERRAALRRRPAPAQRDLRRLDRQSRRVVRLLRLRGVRALLRQRVLSRQRSGRPAAERRHPLRARLHRPADRRLAVRPPRRSLRPAQRADAVGAADVLRLADDRGDADLRVDRRRGAGAARPRAA